MVSHKHSLIRAAIAALALAARAAAEQHDAAGPVRRVLISIPDRKLALIEDGRIVKIYAIAVGAAATPTPPGVFTIANRVENPVWYGHRKIVAAGKSNPVGTRWMGLSAKGYGIHGTNAPRSIGKAASHGCVRMRNADAEELFGLVRVGDEVELIDAVTEEIAAIFSPAEPAGVKAE